MSCNAQQSEALGFVHGNYYVVGEEMEVNRCLTISRSYSADDQPDSNVDFRMPGDLRSILSPAPRSHYFHEYSLRADRSTPVTYSLFPIRIFAFSIVRGTRQGLHKDKHTQRKLKIIHFRSVSRK